jgi:hypothetical protein
MRRARRCTNSVHRRARHFVVPRNPVFDVRQEQLEEVPMPMLERYELVVVDDPEGRIA